ncbi:hypothetical protein H5410_042255 [Solanum commersonii]|uniref:SWIM-type domain-containing protein n=1 Tax=Solanum commersonii TaxID=4109 RepID=A0A9J5XV83_SOLCO|nr:hypothetical protein H5410_042255 [Solanum commersonii]
MVISRINSKFKMMWDYCNEMDRTNLGSTIRMKFTDNKAAAKATAVQQFIVCMNHMFELDPNAAAWCNEKEPSQWTMAYFSSNAKSDMLLNNVCEVYNIMILDARDKPILTLLRKLSYLFMARMLANREKVEQWNLGDVCPKIKDILLKNQKAAGEYIPRKSNQWNYEIIRASIMDNWAVDLEKITCSCRKWSPTGIPCKHTIAAIWCEYGAAISSSYFGSLSVLFRCNSNVILMSFWSYFDALLVLCCGFGKGESKLWNYGYLKEKKGKI